jgi:hypothetical protein
VKIPRPRRLKPSFKRRGSPPPAARKLLRASLGAALLMMAALAIVFVPRGLVYEPLPSIPRVLFASNANAASVRFVVTDVTIVRPLSEYRVEYLNGSHLILSIDPLRDNARNGSLSFHDADRDGQLTLGDEVDVDLAAYHGVESLRLVWIPQNAICGYWPVQP